MPFVRRVTSKKWCTAVQNIEFIVYSLSLLFGQFSSNTVSSPVYYSSFVSKNFPLLKKKKKKKNAWSQVTLEVKCAWWLAFVLHPISLFSFFCFDLPITQTFFDFPWRFDLPGVDCGNQGGQCSVWNMETDGKAIILRSTWYYIS